MRYLIIFLVGCGPFNVYDNNHYSNVVNYPVNANEVTAKGVKVDNSGFDVSMQDIDTKVDKVESCLNKAFPGGILDADTIKSGQCIHASFLLPFVRSDIAVKIAPDWHKGDVSELSKCGAPGVSPEETFPCNIDPQLCVDKGFTITPECPCECRGAVLNNHIVVTTPDLYLFDADLMRIVTSCNMVWLNKLQECFE